MPTLQIVMFVFVVSVGSHTQVTDAGVKELQQALPGCKITH